MCGGRWGWCLCDRLSVPYDGFVARARLRPASRNYARAGQASFRLAEVGTADRSGFGLVRGMTSGQGVLFFSRQDAEIAKDFSFWELGTGNLGWIEGAGWVGTEK